MAHRPRTWSIISRLAIATTFTGCASLLGADFDEQKEPSEPPTEGKETNADLDARSERGDALNGGDDAASGCPGGQVACSSGCCTIVKSVAAGLEHTCALYTDGTVKCWGSNSSGILGNGTNGGSNAVPGVVSGLTGQTALALGTSHSCSASTSGVSCWGSDTNDQIGHAASTTPGAVPNLVSNIEQIAVGAYHSCALYAGTVACWGSNYYGQLGTNTGDCKSSSTCHVSCNRRLCDTSTPVTIGGLVNVTHLAAGDRRTCVVVDGEVRCFGTFDPESCVVSEGVSPWPCAAAIPVTVADVPTPISVAVRRNAVCAVSSNGQAYCSSTVGRVISAAKPVVGLTNVVSIGMGKAHQCALTAGGTVFCWGANDAGAIGDGTKTSRSAPVQVFGLTDVVSLAVGDQHTCAAKADGTVWCWGRNNYSQLGAPSTSQCNGSTIVYACSLSPVQVQGL